MIGRISHYFLHSKRQIYNTVNDLFFFLFFKVYFIIFLIINATTWAAAIYIKKFLDAPRIALHYNVDFGVDYFGAVSYIFLLPSLGLLIFFINIVLFGVVRNQQDRRFIGHILCLVATLANIILLIGIASIFLINTK